jgi:hypothetical protein
MPGVVHAVPAVPMAVVVATGVDEHQGSFGETGLAAVPEASFVFDPEMEKAI